MQWERRPHPDAVKGLYAIEKGVAALVSEGIKELSQMENPRLSTRLIENELVHHEMYIAEIHAHFVKFELWSDEDGRKIMSILDIE